LTGIATIGTPHSGAPIINHIYDWLRFNDAARYYDGQLWTSFQSGHNEHLNWVMNAMAAEGLDWARWLQNVASYQSLIVAGIDGLVPVMNEMRVPSAYLASLNGTANLARETTIPYRVGIVNTPNNFWLGGPLRLLVPPDQADLAGVALHAAAAAL